MQPFIMINQMEVSWHPFLYIKGFRLVAVGFRALYLLSRVLDDWYWQRHSLKGTNSDDQLAQVDNDINEVFDIEEDELAGDAPFWQ